MANEFTSWVRGMTLDDDWASGRPMQKRCPHRRLKRKRSCSRRTRQPARRAHSEAGRSARVVRHSMVDFGGRAIRQCEPLQCASVPQRVELPDRASTFPPQFGHAAARFRGRALDKRSFKFHDVRRDAQAVGFAAPSNENTHDKRQAPPRATSLRSRENDAAPASPDWARALVGRDDEARGQTLPPMPSSS